REVPRLAARRRAARHRLLRARHGVPRLRNREDRDPRRHGTHRHPRAPPDGLRPALKRPEDMIRTTRFHHRHVPARIPGPRERLVVVLHGLGDSLAGWSFLPDALRVPELSYLFVNAPDPYYGGYSWYDFMGDKEPGVLRSRALLLELLDELKEQGVAATDTF